MDAGIPCAVAHLVLGNLILAVAAEQPAVQGTDHVPNDAQICEVQDSDDGVGTSTPPESEDTYKASSSPRVPSHAQRPLFNASGSDISEDCAAEPSCNDFEHNLPQQPSASESESHADVVCRATERAAAAVILAAFCGYRVRVFVRALRTLGQARRELCCELAAEMGLFHPRAASLLAGMHTHVDVRTQLASSATLAIAVREAELRRRVSLRHNPSRPRFRLPRHARIAEERRPLHIVAAERMAALRLHSARALATLAGATAAVAAATATSTAQRFAMLLRLAGAKRLMQQRAAQRARHAEQMRLAKMGAHAIAAEEAQRRQHRWDTAEFPLRCALGPECGWARGSDAGFAHEETYYECGGVSRLYLGAHNAADDDVEVIVLGGNDGGRNEHPLIPDYF